MLAERVRERRRAHVADADRALEHLAVVGDEREQRDGDVQHLGHEPRDAVERGLGGALQQAGLGQRREPPRVPDAGHGQHRPDDRLHELHVALRVLERGHLEPDHVALDGDLGEQRAQAGVAQPARHRELRRQDGRVEHVEVQVHVDLVAAEALHDLGRAHVLDAGRVHQHALAGVEVAHAAHEHARGVDRRLRSRSPTRRRTPPGTCRRGSRTASWRACCSRRGRPATARAHRARGGRPPGTSSGRSCSPSSSEPGTRRPSACPRPDLRPRGCSRASRAGRRPSSRSARRRTCPPGAPRGSSASASASAPREAPGVRSEVRQRSAVTLSGRSTQAPASP